MSSEEAAATNLVGESDEEDEDFSTADTYASYIPAKVKIGRAHPDSVVESSSLSSVQPPDVLIDLKLPEDIIKGGKLSSLQLESVIYATQQHMNNLPDGSRAGFLVGDGAGVGKGRIVAGMIYQNYLEGRKQSIWLSVSNDLSLDAARDLKDLGATEIKIHSLNKFQYGDINGAKNGYIKEGVLFATYSSLIGESKREGEKKTRFDQIVKWLGPQFEGLIVFDECHKAKNVIPSTDTTKHGRKKGSKTGSAVLRLQDVFPKARIVYCSATGASEPRNMAYMSRLGIWGKGTQFNSFDNFIAAVERRGVGAMELVAIDIKLRGMYIARQLSFSGVTFSTNEVQLTDEFVAAYDASAKLWVECRRLFQEAADLIAKHHKKSWKTMWCQFWSSHQRFFKYMCIAAKVPQTITLAKQALEEGKCVVIGLQSTGEARMLDQLESRNTHTVDGFFSSIKGVLETLIQRHFPEFPGQSNYLSGSTDEEAEEEALLSDEESEEEALLSDEEAAMLSDEEEDVVLSSNCDQSPAGDNNQEEELLEFSSDDDLWQPENLKRKCPPRSCKQKQKKLTKPPASKKKGAVKLEKGAVKLEKSAIKLEKGAVKLEKGAMKMEGGAVKVEPANSLPLKRPMHSDTASNSKKIKTEPDLFPECSSPDPVPSPTIFSYNNLQSVVEGTDGKNAQFAAPPGLHAGKNADVYTVKKMKEELLRRLKVLSQCLPKNTLDMLIDGLGGTCRVAEMTGRSGRTVSLPGGIVEYQRRSDRDVSTDLLNIKEKQNFMDGVKDVAIISEAASCGISLQADRRVKNQKRRVHITLELPWSADRAIQQFGRTHRSNQVSAPEYIFLISALAGEQRFASIVAKRLQSLGALTHGDRRASDSRDLNKFNVDTKFGRQALDIALNSILGQELPITKVDKYPTDFFKQCTSTLTGVGIFKPISESRRQRKTSARKLSSRRRRGRHQPYQNPKPGPEPDTPVSLIGMDKEGVTISRFLNRILGLPVQLQNQLFAYFSDTLAAVVNKAKRDGYWDGGIMDFGCSEEQVRITETEDFIAAGVNTQLYTIEVERGLFYDEALKKLGPDTLPDEGFYTTKMTFNNKKAAIMLKVSDSSARYFQVYRPNIGKLTRMEKLSHMTNKYMKETDVEEVKKWWNGQYEESLHTCCHAFWGICKRSSCIAGLRRKTYYMLGGSVLAVWSHIEAVLGSLPINLQCIRIIRVKTSTKRLVGVLIPKACVNMMRETLNRLLLSKK